MNDEVKQFDTISNKYASFVGEDPVRNFLHYPTVIKLLGDIRNKKILDIGCGDGLFDRKLASEYGAQVIGYDKSRELIELARHEEYINPLGIIYSVDDPVTFKTKEICDNSFSVMVLPYSPDKDYLVNFFRSAYESINVGGKFMSVVFNPIFNAFDEVVANRIFKQKDGKIEVNFLDPKRLDGDAKFTALLTQFTIQEYVMASQKVGFKKVGWEKLYPTKEGIDLLGKEFWNTCEQEQPYIVLVLEK